MKAIIAHQHQTETLKADRVIKEEPIWSAQQPQRQLL
jgi:hypothetical protein